VVNKKIWWEANADEVEWKRAEDLIYPNEDDKKAC